MLTDLSLPFEAIRDLHTTLASVCREEATQYAFVVTLIRKNKSIQPPRVDDLPQSSSCAALDGRH